MCARRGRVLFVLLVLLAAMVGACAGGNVGASRWFHAEPPASAVEDYPMPHHLPKTPGGVSLRFAMVHDVIHERYARHGQAYYEKRNEVVRKKLDEEKSKRGPDAPATAERFALLDDLGVGLSFLGQHKEAVELMRAKLKEQEALGLKDRDLYTTYANLGTFLVLWQLAEGLGDKDKATQRLTESVALIHKAIAINPGSHFGREIWQAVVEEYLLALLDKPDLMLEYDMLGDRLDKAIDPEQNRSVQSARDYNPSQRYEKGADGAWQLNYDKGEELRGRFITRAGAEEGWDQGKSSLKEPVPFDEPALGIIGMWRLGGGPNPHFALALGEIMMRVGQRYIAWCAYERAADLASGLGSGPITDKFIENCRRRQKVIEDGMGSTETKAMRARYNDELEHGKRYQQAYRDYEAQQIAAGVALDNPKFYEAFDAQHGEIASPVGEADVFRIWKRGGTGGSSISMPAILMGAGISAFLVAFPILFVRGRIRSGPPMDESAQVP